MAADTLPDDVILEILVRVPDAPALLRCAAVCRCWRALVADPSFLRRRWPDSAYSLLGLFVPKKLNRGVSAVSFLPGPRSALALADGRHLLGSFVPDAAGLPADRVWPLTSHDGLLLLRLRLFSRSHGPRSLAVCSLLAGSCDVLPPFEWHLSCVGHAVLTNADCRQLPPSSSFFKVLMIVQAKDGTGYDLHTFVSSQPTWNAPTKCCLSRGAQLGFVMHGDAFVCQGVAHWLFCASSSFHVLGVDAETSRVSLTKLTSPVSPSAPHVGLNVQRNGSRLATTPDGKILSLSLYDAGLHVVEIWTQPAAGHGQDWPRTGVIDLKPILDQQPRQGRYFSLGGRCGKLLIVLSQRHGYIAHLQTGTIQEVDDDLSSSRPVNSEVVCMEIDWATFFMARLA